VDIACSIYRLIDGTYLSFEKQRTVRVPTGSWEEQCWDEGLLGGHGAWCKVHPEALEVAIKACDSSRYWIVVLEIGKDATLKRREETQILLFMFSWSSAAN
jgi:hypothetical protein